MWVWSSVEERIGYLRTQRQHRIESDDGDDLGLRNEPARRRCRHPLQRKVGTRRRVPNRKMSNRYGRIYHSKYHYNDLRFPSLSDRNDFAKQFNAYHASHDHDGEAPRFESLDVSDIIRESYDASELRDPGSVTIDGYAPYEIQAYHEDQRHSEFYGYQPPTCCVPPIISVNQTLIVSDTLNRHELSAIFTDMPAEDYESLLESVKADGFIDPVIRLIGDEVLDGWHRYGAAKELNLIRKLRFKQWNAEDEGDPAVFVKARNLERRHLTAGQRAQIVVHFNERFGRGNIQSQREDSGSPNGEPKTRDELAKEAGVGTSTIDRAIQVEKAGGSKAVMSGEKSVSEVLETPEPRAASKRLKQKPPQADPPPEVSSVSETQCDWHRISEAMNVVNSELGKLYLTDTEKQQISEMVNGVAAVFKGYTGTSRDAYFRVLVNIASKYMSDLGEGKEI